MSTVESTARPPLLERIKGILLRPSPEWETIASEPTSKAALTTGYVMILAAIPAIAGFVGNSLVGMSFMGISSKLPVVSGLIIAVVGYVLSIVSVYIAAFVINALAPNFGGVKNDVQAFKVAAYAMTAGWLAGIFALLPLLGALGLLGLYGLYLLYTGLPRLMQSPKEKSMGYTAVVVVAMIVIQLIIGGITGAIMATGMMAGGAPNLTGQMKVDTPNGSVQVNGNDLEAAAKKMEAAARAMEEGKATPAVEPAKLDALLPATFIGAAKSEAGASGGGTGSYSASEAHAVYAQGDKRVELKVSDIGAMGALAAFGTAMNVSSSSQSGNSYEKVHSDKGRIISEKWDGDAQSGSYSVVIGERLVIEASGKADMATLKAAVAAINEGQALSLVK
ncbi:Yip1 family protein [Asticcacaulis excentricus]|uniref:Probable membrane protein n=1 Tax=Asticcacaulis excentricus TaxID=78587 RepID=A0A3G9G9D5_9CAUL|nr:Yip1 family protein [Asticcacaulis excentricus]BBF80968.1 probable membrane protein [Asticcacaulis excentricus]